MEKYIASITGVIGAIISYAVDGLGMAVVILIVMMGIDYISGIMVGIVQRNLNSRIGWNGVVRKLYYLLLVGAVYAISYVVPGIEFAGDGIAIALCAMELISVTENGSKIGLPMPKVVQDLLLIVKDKSDKPGGEN